MCYHMRLLDGDAGPNTDGMGAYAPSDLSSEIFDQIVDQLMRPVVRALAEAGTPFCGALYAGVMLTEQGPQILQFNARFGDPETQVIVPLLGGDLLAALLACAQSRLVPDMLSWGDRAAACVVLAAANHPEAPRHGDVIYGLETATEFADVLVFHAGTEWADSTTVTAGGRVLCVTGLGRTRKDAQAAAYQMVDNLQFDGMQYRRDIGRL